MYSVNHPHAAAIVQLGKIIGYQLGSGEDVWDKDIKINDGLTDVIWPVYPEVADALALEGGSYTWKLGGHSRIVGLPSYVRFAYDNYRKLGIEPQDLAIAFFDDKRLDAVLGAHAETSI